ARRRSSSSAIFPCPPATTTRMPPAYLPWPSATATPSASGGVSPSFCQAGQAASASSGAGRAGWLVGLVGAEHGEDDVAAAAGQADERGVMAFAFGAFAVVERFGRGVAQRGERGDRKSTRLNSSH